MKIGLIGDGAIAGFARAELEERGHEIAAVLMRPEKAGQKEVYVGSVEALPNDLDVIIDCAGHQALLSYGADILRCGYDLITVSLGALADDDVFQSLKAAARQGGAKLHLASGAIGALDCLKSAQVGTLHSVTYVGRKPPKGWLGSPAEDAVDLNELTNGAEVHFEGSARQAALAYPKNANVAAAVALAGIGFDRTDVKLIADSDIESNIHEIEATGDFGSFHFQIKGNSLPDNPRSSALAAMSVISKIDDLSSGIVF